MNKTAHRYNKRILLAVDASENSRRAVTYVAQMIGSLEGFCLVFLHVINVPEEDYFSCRAEREKWIQSYQLEIKNLLEEYRNIFVSEGFDPKAISLQTTFCYRPSIADCILAEQKRLDCSTIVIGKQGLSRSEEILFGSISSKIVNHAKNCTVWVVE